MSRDLMIASIACCLLSVPAQLLNFSSARTVSILPPMEALDDPESSFALGEKITLARADEASLELIPGVSDGIAIELVQEKQKIIASASKTRGLDKARAFEIIRGIGPAKAQTLAEHLSLEPGPASETFQRPPLALSGLQSSDAFH